MTKDDFLKLQELQRNSGLSLMKYLKEKGLSYSTYNYWNRKFRSLESEESEIPFAQVLIVSAKRYHHSGVSGTIVSLEAVPL